MFKFIKSKQVTLFVASLLTSVGLFSATTVLSHAGFVTTPGNVCQPANLAQALARGMSWNAFRVFNPSDTQSFFVTCGISKSNGDLQDSTEGAVVAHFDVGHNPADSVSCIWRVNRESVVATNIPTTVVALTGNVFNSGRLPATSFNDRDFPVGENNIAPGAFWTVTCLLPPKTGINDFNVFGYRP